MLFITLFFSPDLNALIESLNMSCENTSISLDEDQACDKLSSDFQIFTRFLNTDIITPKC